MYKAKLIIEEIKELNKEPKYITSLKVSFNFKKEIPPKDRRKIKERCKIPNRSSDYNYIEDYLKKKGFEKNIIDIIDIIKDNIFNKKLERKDKFISYFKIQILPGYNKLGFNIKGIAEEKINNLEEIINLEELNNFILK